MFFKIFGFFFVFFLSIDTSDFVFCVFFLYFSINAVSISFYIEDDDDVNNTNEMNRSGMSPAPAHLLQMMQMRGIGGSVIEGTLKIVFFKFYHCVTIYIDCNYR